MKLRDLWHELIVPDDLVYFSHNESRLVTNPALGAWCLLNKAEWSVLFDIARRYPPCQDPCLERTLAKLVLNCLVYLPGQVPKPSIPDPPLKIVYYAITEGCNLRCPYCYASSEKCLPGELTTEESVDLMLQAAAIGVRTVVFTGGEPMLRKDLFEVAAAARRQGMRANLITNGTMVRTPEIADTIARTFDRVTVSIDGGTAEVHEHTRGKGTFAQTAHALKLLNSAGVVPDINHVVTPGNVETLDKLFDFISDLKVRDVRLMHHNKLGRAVNEEQQFGWSDFMRVQFFRWEYPNVRKLIPEETKASKPCSIKGNCGMGGNEIYVTSLGDVYPCKLVTESKHRAGNLRQRKLAELFASPVLADMRRSNVFSGENLVDCRRCYIRGGCGGGCRAYHSAETGEIYKNGRHLCRILRHSMVSKMWQEHGATGAELSRNHEEMLRPHFVKDDTLHPAYEDWKQARAPLLPILV